MCVMDQTRVLGEAKTMNVLHREGEEPRIALTRREAKDLLRELTYYLLEDQPSGNFYERYPKLISLSPDDEGGAELHLYYDRHSNDWWKVYAQVDTNLCHVVKQG